MFRPGHQSPVPPPQEERSASEIRARRFLDKSTALLLEGYRQKQSPAHRYVPGIEKKEISENRVYYDFFVLWSVRYLRVSPSGVRLESDTQS